MGRRLTGGFCVAMMWAAAPNLTRAQDAFFSLEGSFALGADTHIILFELSDEVTDADRFEFRTFHHSGGTNAAGDIIAGGSFDPLLELVNRGRGDREHAENNDGFLVGSDSMLSWEGVAPNWEGLLGGAISQTALRAGRYQLRLNSLDSEGVWAVDLIGPAERMAIADEFCVEGSALTKLTVGEGGRIGLDGIEGGQTVKILSGAQLTMSSTPGFFFGSADSAPAILIVDGSGSSASADRIALNHKSSGTIYVRNGATARWGSIYLAPLGEQVSGYLSTLNIESGARVTTSHISLSGDQTIGSGIINIDGAGSVLEIGSSPSLSIVSETGPTAMNITNGGALMAWGPDGMDGAVEEEADGGPGDSGGELRVGGMGTLFIEGMMTMAGGDGGAGIGDEEYEVFGIGGDGGSGGLVTVYEGVTTIKPGGTLLLQGGDGGMGGGDIGSYYTAKGGDGGLIEIRKGLVELEAGGILLMRGGKGGEGVVVDGLINGNGDAGDGGDGGKIVISGGEMLIRGGRIDLPGGQPGVRGLNAEGEFAGESGFAGRHGAIELRGGKLSVPGGEFDEILDRGELVFESGLLHLTDDGPVGSVLDGVSRISHAVAMLREGQELIVDHGLSIEGGVMTLAGGSLTTPMLSRGAGAALILSSGELNLTADDLEILDGGPLGERAQLGEMDVNVMTGSLIVAEGASLTGSGNVTSWSIKNAGQINVIGGSLAADDASLNEEGAQIVAVNALLNFSGGLVNLGTLSLINTEVAGDLESPASAEVAVLGHARFMGAVRGGADFTGGGHVIFEDLYDPGDEGELAVTTLNGDVTFGETAHLRIEVFTDEEQILVDWVDIDGLATLGGTLEVVLTGEGLWVEDEVFTIMTFDDRDETFFNELVGADFGEGLMFQPVYDATSLSLRVIRELILGDFDGNGVLDAFDIDEFELALGDPEGFMAAYPDLDPDLLGDFDGDGSFDAFDVDEFEVVLAGGGGSSHVPEPGSLLVMGVGGLMVLRRRR